MDNMICSPNFIHTVFYHVMFLKCYSEDDSEEEGEMEYGEEDEDEEGEYEDVMTGGEEVCKRCVTKSFQYFFNRLLL